MSQPITTIVRWGVLFSLLTSSVMAEQSDPNAWTLCAMNTPAATQKTPTPEQMLTCSLATQFTGLGELMCGNTGAELPLHQCMAKACAPVIEYGSCRRRVLCYDIDPALSAARFSSTRDGCAVQLVAAWPLDYVGMPAWLFMHAYRVQGAVFHEHGFPLEELYAYSEPNLNLVLWNAANRDRLSPAEFAVESMRVAEVQRIAYTYNRWQTEYWDEDTVLLATIIQDMEVWRFPPRPIYWESREHALERMRDAKGARNAAMITEIEPVAQALRELAIYRGGPPERFWHMGQSRAALEAGWDAYQRALAERGLGFDEELRLVDAAGRVVDRWWWARTLMPRR